MGSTSSFRFLCDNNSMQNRMRNSSMSGGYPQQGGYQARPPSNWQQPGPPMQQQSGYGYVQPGTYPGPPQYNQPPYSGYPPQPTSGGYTTGWEQSSAPQNQGGSYDYYNQQQPPQQQPVGGSNTPTDASAYNYSQGQGYSQDGYSGYQSGYGQPQSNPTTGYDQQQQGYNSTYANVSNPPSDGHTPSYASKQVDPNQAPAPAPGQPSPNPNYPAQASTQPSYGTHQQPSYGNYGAPQAQKSSTQPGYAQLQKSPSAQSGGYAQPEYPGYAQTDSSAQRPPSSAYGAMPYGAPPAYSSGYGGGYSQPPAYSSDATPPSQSAQSSGAAKASPPS